ncbi:hypothetical protein ACRB8A_19520 (plasmid) [Arthrobacter sp. G.S.26]|uniref:hypothetical protein n=1 Tax=Arthrobacter sp. G.S.26 TaxID=3433706 RepID=UPI003D785A1B
MKQGEEPQAGVSIQDISVGDKILAWHNGKVYFRGVVVSTVRSLGLISIKCAEKGVVRLIDTTVLTVTKVDLPDSRLSVHALFLQP